MIPAIYLSIQELDNLKELDLSHSPFLIKIPDLSKATKLRSVNLEGCTTLLKVPSSISNLSMLILINLKDCQNIRTFPSTVDLKFVETLVLSGCSRLQRFPKVSRNIRNLYLEETAIKEVPLSVGCLNRLVRLYMANCTKLGSLPSSICKLKSLRYFDLSGCKKLKNFQKSWRP